MREGWDFYISHTRSTLQTEGRQELFFFVKMQDFVEMNFLNWHEHGQQ